MVKPIGISASAPDLLRIIKLIHKEYKFHSSNPKGLLLFEYKQEWVSTSIPGCNLVESYSLFYILLLTNPSTENGNFPYVRIVRRTSVSKDFSCAFGVVSTVQCVIP